MRLRPLMSSSCPDWFTPEPVWRPAVEAFGSIGLDPCAHPESTVPARVRRFKHGLRDPWSGHGLVWLNPPYGIGIGEWTARAREDGDHVIGLLPARVDTRWWHQDVAPAARRVVLVRGRLRFGLPAAELERRYQLAMKRRKGTGDPTVATFPSALVYWGREWRRFVEAYADLGWVVAGGGRRRRLELAELLER